MHCLFMANNKAFDIGQGGKGIITMRDRCSFCTVNWINTNSLRVSYFNYYILQRDLFNIFLIHAAMKSNTKEHKCLARLVVQKIVVGIWKYTFVKLPLMHLNLTEFTILLLLFIIGSPNFVNY